MMKPWGLSLIKPWGLSRPETDPPADELTHIFCYCDVDRALCGADLSAEEIVDEWNEADECVVCLDLNGAACERCGQ